MGSFTVRTRGTVRKAPLPITPDGGRCQSSDRAKVSGLSFILRMRPLPAFARWVGAPPPPQLTEQEAREVAGEDALYDGTQLSGASNDKAKKTFNFKPRRLQRLNP